MAKVAKVRVTERELVKAELRNVLQEAGANLIGEVKEGLVLEVNGKHVVIRTILKKELIEKTQLRAIS